MADKYIPRSKALYDAEIAKAMTEKTKASRKPEMKSYTLPKDDVDALVAYVASLKK